MKNHFIKFYLVKKSFRKYCVDEGIVEQRSQLARIGLNILLQQMKSLGRPWFFVQQRLIDYYKKKDEARKQNVKKLHKDNCVLTVDEENTIVETCRFLSRCGMGVDRDTCLDLVNEILKTRVEIKEFQDVTRGVVNRLIAKNNDLLDLFSGNSIDASRVRQANVDVRDAMFVKLDNYIKFLYAAGKVTWKCWAEVPPWAMSNMDEVATNCQDHRK